MEKPFHEWTRNELLRKERVYPIANEYGDEIRAEITAAAVLWLCSPAASFVIGVGLPVDGGFTAH